MSSRSNWLSGAMLVGAIATAITMHLAAHKSAQGEEDPCNPAVDILQNLGPEAPAQQAVADKPDSSSQDAQTEAIQAGTGVVAGSAIATGAGKLQKDISNAETTLKNAALDKLDKPIEALGEKARKPLRSKPVRAASAWVQIGAWIYAGWEGITYAWGRIFDDDHDQKVAAARAAERAEAEQNELALSSDIADADGELPSINDVVMRGCD